MNWVEIIVQALKNWDTSLIAYVPDISIEYVDSPIMNQLSYTVSDGRFRDLGFNTKGTLEQGIRETVELLAGIVGDRVWESTPSPDRT